MHCGDYGKSSKVKKYVNLNDTNALNLRLRREQLQHRFAWADAGQPQHGGGEGLEPEVKPEEVPQNVNVDVKKAEEDTVAAPHAGETKPDEKTLGTNPNEAGTINVKPDEVQTVDIKSDETKIEIKSDETKVEIKPDEIKEETKPDETKVETKLDETKVESIPDEVITPEAEVVEQNSADADWKDREAKLLKIINDLELVKNDKSEDSLKIELKLREEEAEFLKARVKNLETELQAALSKPSGKNHEMIENIKHQHEELLSKARGMIFDKTKMVKNQELQIEALTTQVQSLKDVNMITKDLLEIRNSEIKAMEERLQAMEARFKAEKERFGLVLQRAQTSTNINTDLKKEYETQLNIFKELRTKYDLRVQALVAENERLKASVNGASTS